LIEYLSSLNFCPYADLAKQMDYVLGKREVGGFAISECLYPAKLRQARHKHTFASFSLVLAGSYVENFGGQSLTRQPSTVVFHPPQESHSVDFQSRPVRILNVQLDLPRLAYFREQSSVLNESASYCGRSIGCLGQRLRHEFRRMDFASPLSIEGLVCEILAEGSRHKKTGREIHCPAWVKDAETFLQDNFSQSLVFEDVAKIVGVHPVHLARGFRQKNGCTMGEYVRRLRLEYACQQISATKTLLGEIALAAGFTDQSHLNKTFKAAFGLTPSQYRKFSRALK
jgi:AraC family transcriptional regulator